VRTRCTPPSRCTACRVADGFIALGHVVGEHLADVLGTIELKIEQRAARALELGLELLDRRLGRLQLLSHRRLMLNRLAVDLDLAALPAFESLDILALDVRSDGAIDDLGFEHLGRQR